METVVGPGMRLVGEGIHLVERMGTEAVPSWALEALGKGQAARYKFELARQ